MSRDQLLKEYDRFGDYWAVWLGRASMLPETFSDYTDHQLRDLIKFASSPWARSNWKYHDYEKYKDEHNAFYEEFFKVWDTILGKSQRTSKIRSKRKLTRRQRRDFHTNRHTKSKDSKRSKRPSPSASAAETPLHTKAKGNDGNMYVIKMDKRGIKKWMKM